MVAARDHAIDVRARIGIFCMLTYTGPPPRSTVSVPRASRARAASLGELGASTSALAYAQKGASVGASVGSVIPVVGSAVGAAIGAVLGAIGGAFKRTKRPESAFWDEYKKTSGKVRGIEYDPQFLSQAFVGLMRLGGRTNFPPKVKYGQKGDKDFLDAMAAAIADAVRAGKLGPEDDGKSILEKVVKPWSSGFGGTWAIVDDWSKWENQIIVDLIDNYIHDIPIVSTSYTESRRAIPSIGEVVRSLPKPAPPPPVAAPAPPAVTPLPAPAPFVPTPLIQPKPKPTPPTASPIPAGYVYQGKTPGGHQLYAAPTGGLYVWDGAVMLPYTAPATVTPPPPSTSSPPPQIPPATADHTRSVIDALLAQGQSQQQAFAAAMQSLAAAGVQPTPQIQQAVAEEVKTQATGQSINWPIVLGIGSAAGLGLLLILRSRRGKR
jgi:hypothetical protein